MGDLKRKMWWVLFAFVAVIGVITGLMYRSCYGIAYGESGELVVGMENPLTHTDYLYFYDSGQSLAAAEKISSVDFSRTGRYSRPVMNFNENFISVYSKPAGTVYYDYGGRKIDGGYDENAQNAGYYFETQDGGTVEWEQRFGFEYVSVRAADGGRKNIGFWKIFLCKILDCMKLPALIGLNLILCRPKNGKKDNFPKPRSGIISEIK